MNSPASLLPTGELKEIDRGYLKSLRKKIKNDASPWGGVINKGRTNPMGKKRWEEKGNACNYTPVTDTKKKKPKKPDAVNLVEAT